MTRRTSTIAATALVALALAGCGGSSNNSTSSAAASSAAASAPAASSAPAAGTTLHGTVGPGFTIALDQTSVAAGTYTLEVDDQADAHNFHLTGPGVDVKTEVPFVGKKSFTVTLTAGTYTFVCDPHSSQMHGTLTVT